MALSCSLRLQFHRFIYLTSSQELRVLTRFCSIGLVILRVRLLVNSGVSSSASSPFKASGHSLFFGRDPLGRRSLLIRRINELDSSWSIELASVSLGAPGDTGSGPEFYELTTAAIFQFQLDQLTSAPGSLEILDAANYDALQILPTLGTPDATKEGIIAHWRSARDKFVRVTLMPPTIGTLLKPVRVSSVSPAYPQL